MKLKNISIAFMIFTITPLYAMDNAPAAIKYFSPYGISLSNKDKYTLPVVSSFNKFKELKILKDKVDIKIKNKFFSAAEELHLVHMKQLTDAKLPFYIRGINGERNTISTLKKLKNMLGDDLYSLKLKEKMYAIYACTNSLLERERLISGTIEEINNTETTKEKKDEYIERIHFINRSLQEKDNLMREIFLRSLAGENQRENCKQLESFQHLEYEVILRKKIKALELLEEEIRNNASLPLAFYLLARSFKEVFGQDITKIILQYARFKNTYISQQIADEILERKELIAGNNTKTAALYLSYKTIADLVQCIVEDRGQIHGNIHIHPVPEPIIQGRLVSKDNNYVDIGDIIKTIHHIFYKQPIQITIAKELPDLEATVAQLEEQFALLKDGKVQ